MTKSGWEKLYIPTHRKKRDGWGTRAFVAEKGQRIPSLRYGMELQGRAVVSDDGRNIVVVVSLQQGFGSVVD